MDSATNNARDMAVLVFAFEDGQRDGSGSAPSTLDIVFEKLRIRLSNSFGTNGYKALVSRSLALAANRAPWISQLTVASDGALRGFEDATATIDQPLVFDGCIAIITSYFELLQVFIGNDLTTRLLSRVWPDTIKVEAVDSKENRNG